MKDRLRILLDLDSLKSSEANNLMQYFDNDQFELIKVQESHVNVDLTIHINEKDKSYYKNGLEIIKNPMRPDFYKQSRAFGHSYDEIEKLSKYFGIKFWDLVLVYIVEELLDGNKNKVILVTENQTLLNLASGKKRKNSLKLTQNSILNPREASIYIDLYCKSLGKYLIAPNYYVNKGLWYLYSMKHKTSEYQSMWTTLVYGENILPHGKDFFDIGASLGDRLTDMLISVDEIGKSYYIGSNNDTKDNMIYHFNYWITLFTGILDTLAWISAYRYDLFDEMRLSNIGDKQIGLRNKINKSFLNLLVIKDPKLVRLIKSHSKLINLLYTPRDMVIHRSRLKGTRYKNENKVELNMIRIPELFLKHIQNFSKNNGSKPNEWGHFIFAPDIYLLEPYSFTKKVTIELIQFTNSFLSLLDFTQLRKDFSITIPRHKRTDDFQKMVKGFGEYKLGF